MTSNTHRRAAREARVLVQAYVATDRGASTPETMRDRLCSVVASMPHLFHTVDGVRVLRESCNDIDAMRTP